MPGFFSLPLSPLAAEHFFHMAGRIRQTRFPLFCITGDALQIQSAGLPDSRSFCFLGLLLGFSDNRDSRLSPSSCAG